MRGRWGWGWCLPGVASTACGGTSSERRPELKANDYVERREPALWYCMETVCWRTKQSQQPWITLFIVRAIRHKFVKLIAESRTFLSFTSTQTWQDGFDKTFCLQPWWWRPKTQIYKNWTFKDQNLDLPSMFARSECCAKILGLHIGFSHCSNLKTYLTVLPWKTAAM